MVLPLSFLIICSQFWAFFEAGKGEHFVADEQKWVDQCVADYKQRMESLEKGKRSIDSDYPTNYEAAYHYEKLHVSDLIYPLKIHGYQHPKRTEISYASNGESSESKNGRYENRHNTDSMSGESEEKGYEDRKSVQHQHSRSSARVHTYRNRQQYSKFHPKDQYPPHVQPLDNRPISPPLTPSQPLSPISPPSQAFPQPPQRPDTQASCSRQAIDKCSPFSRCIDGSGSLHGCWGDGDDMVFDEHTQGCRSSAVIPNCKKEIHCANRLVGWKNVGGECTKLAVMCGILQRPNEGDKRVCPANLVMDPHNEGNCVDRSMVSACLRFSF